MERKKFNNICIQGQENFFGSFYWIKLKQGEGGLNSKSISVQCRIDKFTDLEGGVVDFLLRGVLELFQNLVLVVVEDVLD